MYKQYHESGILIEGRNLMTNTVEYQLLYTVPDRQLWLQLCFETKNGADILLSAPMFLKFFSSTL